MGFVPPFFIILIGNNMDELNIKLVKISKEYKNQLFEMMDEWIKEKKEDYCPHVIFKNDYHDFDYYILNIDVKKATDKLVPSSTFFAYDINRDKLLGAISIRHYLNEHLLFCGGHIGDGVRPSERRKGVATKMISLALIECKKLGIDKVLMVCNKNNIGSRKSIINNGGIKENEVIDNNEVLERYWINI